MEVIVYFTVEKPLFKRVVMCPDAFDINSFVSNMKAIFGEKITIQIIIT
jgi:hypothetical protein